MTRRRWLLPYLLMAPGLLWLAALLRPAQHPDGPDVPLDGEHQPGLDVRLGLRQLHRGVRPLPGQLPQLARVRRHGDAGLLPHRLSDGVRDRVPWRSIQDAAAVPRHRAVLHELPDPDDLLADPARGPGAVPGRGPRHARRRPGQLQRHRDAARRRRRADLPVPAVHGAARSTSRSRRSTSASSKPRATCTPGRGGAAGRSPGRSPEARRSPSS